jgi:hypothetical protein
VKFVTSVIAGLLFCPLVHSQQPEPQPKGTVPRLVNISGRAREEQGKPVSGIVGLSFAVYKDQFEDTPLWMETQNATVDVEGNYSVQLGATSPDGLPLDLFNSAEALAWSTGEWGK